ncbi:MAG TPA: helix-turn-helix domain-containing protein [Pirellulaceae bacterium]|nr:helix-turn-helix domain-containing protein [Pirellulaceae bacterium]
MSERKIERVSRGRKLTSKEAARYRKLRAEIEAEKPAIKALVQRRIAEMKDLARVFSELKRAREDQGLSLSDMQDKTGIDRSALSKLETGQRDNYTVETILRYADAVGKRIVFELADR